jgi:drug/metabolite transporter (DMT)-like permease
VSADHTAPPRPGDSRSAAGITAVVVAVSVWGTSSVLIKQVPELDAAAVATYRLWIGAASVTAIFLAGGGRLSVGLVRRSFWGGVAFWADIVLFFSALQRTSVANATVIGALQPLLLLLVAGRMFGERARWSQAGWGALAIGGAAVVVLGGESGGASGGGGDALAVGALVAWTAYFIASKRAREVLSSLEYLAGLSIVAAVLAVPTPALLGIGMEMPSAKGWAIITTIAMVNGALGHFLMNWAHAHVPLVVTSLLTLAVPVVAAAMAAVVLHEPLVALQVVGMAVVVGALGVVAVEGARRQPQAFADEQAALAAAPEP